jgi:hypothetical protein
MLARSLLFAFVLLFATSLVSADPITYDVSVDTSSIFGTAGSLDFQFNPGPLVSQAASLQILNFTSDGTLDVAGPTLSGDVGGALPNPVTFDNGMSFNDYFQGFTFGNMLNFQVSLYGPALSSPDGVSTSESRFAFSMFSDAGGTTPALTTDTNGFAAFIDVKLNGTTAGTNFSNQTTIVPETAPTAVPEPGSLALLGTVVTGLAFLQCRRRAGNAHRIS